MSKYKPCVFLLWPTTYTNQRTSLLCADDKQTSVCAHGLLVGHCMHICHIVKRHGSHVAVAAPRYPTQFPLLFSFTFSCNYGGGVFATSSSFVQIHHQYLVWFPLSLPAIIAGIYVEVTILVLVTLQSIFQRWFDKNGAYRGGCIYCYYVGHYFRRVLSCQMNLLLNPDHVMAF